MRVKIYSDLHLEFPSQSPLDLEAGEADLVILAGDVHTKGRGVAWAQSTFTPLVAYVSGNHEFYGGHIDRTLQKMKHLASGSNVHVLENETLEIGNVRVLGATAWSDFTAGGRPFQSAEVARRSMNDFRLIRSGERYRALSISDVINRNRITYEWLAQELSKKFDGKTIVVTHYCPIINLSGPEQGSSLMPAFTNEWPELVAQADLWVFGHTHSHVDVEFYGCRVVSNPRGYPQEGCGFDPRFTVEI
ncbi:metallophosphoesterase [Pseudomonas fontis]|uniref:Metallophosphoesterase n=1 Tax=Pseudomonas fontis TaxID=2942633 RepID=A0ABT5NTD5_9PSED|nr:metallophosphoesterase [Pseudomonas fontis]MDD0976917.1 metallophosphoesterase [Pseudomonas fontis]MDD0991434.1 metallophosphoesterase [Pseudomonas fontis]